MYTDQGKDRDPFSVCAVSKLCAEKSCWMLDHRESFPSRCVDVTLRFQKPELIDSTADVTFVERGRLGTRFPLIRESTYLSNNTLN